MNGEEIPKREMVQKQKSLSDSTYLQMPYLVCVSRLKHEPTFEMKLVRWIRSHSCWIQISQVIPYWS